VLQRLTTGPLSLIFAVSSSSSESESAAEAATFLEDYKVNFNAEEKQN
jgi:hypothetical protein